MSTTLYDSIPEDLRVFVQPPLDDSHLTERKYRLRITQEMEHSRGIAWTGQLMAGDTVVAVVENAGYGGANDYVIKEHDSWGTFADDAYKAYGNNSQAKDSLIQFIDVMTTAKVS